MRTIIGSNLVDRWFFVFGFEKTERANVHAKELVALQKLTTSLLAMSTKLLDRAIDEGELVEISDEEKPTSQ